MKVTIIPQQVTAVISSIDTLYNLIKKNEQELVLSNPALKEVILKVEHNSIEALMSTARSSSRYTISTDQSVITIALVFFMEPTSEKIAQAVSKEIDAIKNLALSVAS